MKKTLMAIAFSFASSSSMAFDPGTVECAPTTVKEFMPSIGTVEITENSTFGRHVIQSIYWQNEARLKWFKDTPDSTFEPDTIFYNYDGLSYVSGSTGYWDSDLPGAYLDTTFQDKDGEIAITVGSARATDIRSGKFYYTFSQAAAGAGDSSWVKVSGQRGLRVPTFCESTWCSFGCEEISNIKMISFQDHWVVPDSRRTYLFDYYGITNNYW